VRQERAGLDTGDRLTDVGIQVTEGLGRPRWPDAGIRLDAGLERVVGELEHPAVGVVDEDDLRGAKQPLTDGQRPDPVVGDHPAGVADHVRVAVREAEDGVHVQPGIHAGDDCDAARGRRGRLAAERGGKPLVVPEQFIGAGHARLLAVLAAPVVGAGGGRWRWWMQGVVGAGGDAVRAAGGGAVLAVPAVLAWPGMWRELAHNCPN
jgi:hypothetical protein